MRALIAPRHRRGRVIAALSIWLLLIVKKVVLANRRKGVKRRSICLIFVFLLIAVLSLQNSEATPTTMKVMKWWVADVLVGSNFTVVAILNNKEKSNKLLGLGAREAVPAEAGLPAMEQTGLKQTGPKKPLCIGGQFWGDHFNRIVQLSTMLDILNEENSNSTTPAKKLGMGSAWSKWYRTWFALNDKNDHKDKLLLDHHVSLRLCDRILDTKQLHHEFLRRKRLAIESRSGSTTNTATTSDIWLPSPSLAKLIPQKSIRIQAAEAISGLKKRLGGRQFVSVHRRSLERNGGDCTDTARKPDFYFCFRGTPRQLGIPYLASFCNLTYSHLLNTEPAIIEENTTTAVVLFTDGHKPELDNTFPFMDDTNHSFQVQAWMMTRSDLHYGNPLSSIDYVVAHWRRKRNMFPQQCYA